MIVLMIHSFFFVSARVKYKFQREYLGELKRLGIVSICTPLLEIADEEAEGVDAISGIREMKVEAVKDAAKETKFQKKAGCCDVEVQPSGVSFYSFSWCSDHVPCSWSQVDGAFSCS